MPQKHILIIEDEAHLGVGIKYNLEAEGHRVTLVNDGHTALRLLEAEPSAIDLVILDLMLPGMSGYAVCETIRAWGLEIPVLMLSARTLPEDRRRGFDVGTNQYLSKPFDLDELISRVANLLRLQPRGVTNLPQRETALRNLRLGSAEIDFDQHTVMVAGQPSKLSTKELRVLRYLAERPGRVISRPELLAEVWGLSGHLQTRAVDQCIARLRKTLEPDPANPRYILTVRDAGYRLARDENHLAADGAKPDD
jgi:two-component system OmpR family response regulator